MAHLDIIRAWKDEEYRLSLSEAERALLPAHPAGLMELTDAQLDVIEGGSIFGPIVIATWYLSCLPDSMCRQPSKKSDGGAPDGGHLQAYRQLPLAFHHF